MSDRTLCDSTRISKTLARLSDVALGLWPYIFQETDDYGKLDTDSNLIKAQRFPLIMWVTPPIIEHCIQEYQRVKMLFLWQTEDHRYGKFVNFDAQSGRYLSKRRKSIIPDPPVDKLAKFLSDNNHFQTLPSVPNTSYKLSQVKLSQVKKDKDKETAPPSQFPRTVEKTNTVWEETKANWKKAFGKECTNQMLGLLLKSGWKYVDAINQFAVEYGGKVDDPYAYALNLARKYPQTVNQIRSRAYKTYKFNEMQIGRIMKKLK